MASMSRASKVAAAGGVLTFVATAVRARHCRVQSTEESVFRSLNELPDSMHVPVWMVMQFGSLGAVFAAAGAAATLRRPRLATALAASGVGIWMGAKAVKHLVGRERPDSYLEQVRIRGRHQSGLGFPSGHAAVALTLAIVAASKDRPLLTTALFGAAGATATARMYVGAHLPLDVVGGLGLGMATGLAGRALLRRLVEASG